MRKIKFAAIALAGALAFTAISATNVFAGDDEFGFAFEIQPWYENSRVKDSEAKYRQTTNIYNQWKVALQSSDEGEKTITRFWMENYAEKNVTAAISAKQGAVPYYNPAYQSASKVTCYLTAENNNYLPTTYSVAGIWDEETGVVGQ